MDANGLWYGLMGDPSPKGSPKILVIGAGSRGNTYARAVEKATRASITAVAEPNKFKRERFGQDYIWGQSVPRSGQSFEDWRHFVIYEKRRREQEAAGQDVDAGVDAAFICTLDEQHAEILIALAPLNLHILCEKPLATTLEDCVEIYSSFLQGLEGELKVIFGIGHVLRYSPVNILLRKLLLQDRAISDIVSAEVVEPIGFWHFSHSYCRGSWRKESTTAPSLLTKSCHDIDFLLWLLCSPPTPDSDVTHHLPSKVSSTGHLNYFRKSRKPAAAGDATNCLSCPIERSCKYSAKRIYVDRHLKNGNTSWPVKVVNPHIEDLYRSGGFKQAEAALLSSLGEDYEVNTDAVPASKEVRRPYYGRCVWEADNDVCDDQFVTITWDEEHKEGGGNEARHLPKTANFHMIAHTEDICQRRGRFYGTAGEITYNQTSIRVYDFESGQETIHYPGPSLGGHGGGDEGLVKQFVKAVDAVMNEGVAVANSQAKYLGCSLEEILRSHALVFAAEEARRDAKVVDWKRWWKAEVEDRIRMEKNSDGEYEIV